MQKKEGYEPLKSPIALSSLLSLTLLHTGQTTSVFFVSPPPVEGNKSGHSQLLGFAVEMSIMTTEACQPFFGVFLEISAQAERECMDTENLAEFTKPLRKGKAPRYTLVSVRQVSSKFVRLLQVILFLEDFSLESDTGDKDFPNEAHL